MIRLNLSSEPRWVDLLPGLRLKVAPVSTAVMSSARFDSAIETAEGDEALGFEMAKAVARRVITEWEGIGDDSGAALAVTPEHIDALLDIWPVFEAFQEKVLGPALLLDAEKNG